jgi:cytochrome c biogenesis protein CcmG/thiol:disulfide interchange protein DsbE
LAINLAPVRRVLWLLVAVALISSVGLAIWRGRTVAVSDPSSSSTNAGDQASPLVGKALPYLRLATIDGRAADPRQLIGRPALLNVWATWCIPCRAEMPDIEHEAQVFRGRATVVGIDQGEDSATITGFTQGLGITYTIWRDPTDQVEKLLNAPGLPYSIFVDRGGIVRWVYLGQVDRVYIEARLKQLLGS